MCGVMNQENVPGASAISLVGQPQVILPPSDGSKQETSVGLSEGCTPTTTTTVTVMAQTNNAANITSTTQAATVTGLTVSPTQPLGRINLTIANGK